MTWKKKTRTKKVGTTKHGKAGAHGRGRHGSPLASAAKVDAWKHFAQGRTTGRKAI